MSAMPCWRSRRDASALSADDALRLFSRQLMRSGARAPRHYFSPP